MKGEGGGEGLYLVLMWAVVVCTLLGPIGVDGEVGVGGRFYDWVMRLGEEDES